MIGLYSILDQICHTKLKMRGIFVVRIDLKDAATGISGLSAVAAALLLNLLLTSIAFGHEPKPAKKTTLVGHIVGTACYMGHESKGEEHLACATECAKAGIPLAILESGTGKLYLPLASDHHSSANKQLMPYIEKDVRVSGTVVEKGGLKAIVIDKIEGAEPQ